LTQPVSYPADKYAARTLVEKLEKLELGDLVTEQKGSHAEHEVDDRGGARVTVSDGRATLADFIVGKAVGDHTMLRLAGRDQVYQAVGSLRAVFSKEVKLWRERAIFNFPADDARALRVTTRSGEVALSRADDKAPWKIDRAAPPVDKLDADAPRALLSSMASLSAADFADNAAAAQTGLDQPEATVTVQLKDKTEKQLLVGKSDKDNFSVKAGSAPQVFLIARYAAESLIKRPIDFRDKTIFSFKPEELTELGITHLKGGQRTAATLARKGDAWHKDGKPLSDQTKPKGAAEALATLVADRCAAQSAAELGMSTPEWRLALRLKDGRRLALTVGAKEQDGFFGVQREGLADLFACRKYKLDRFLLDPPTLN
jgi:hypothetical protein